jgi:hypothetical protein
LEWKNANVFYSLLVWFGYLVYLIVNKYTCGHLVYFPPFWYIVPRKILQPWTKEWAELVNPIAGASLPLQRITHNKKTSSDRDGCICALNFRLYDWINSILHKSKLEFISPFIWHQILGSFLTPVACQLLGLFLQMWIPTISEKKNEYSVHTHFNWQS